MGSNEKNAARIYSSATKKSGVEAAKKTIVVKD
ncbi:hypothetical protein P872_06695 [Rhodonellum psychrophilum GCM71 = DSM 17998]|uniref:Uncharacterized protein n=1 Tax=Rhodonellum psychrophilum GCM71 = DSM 17998 TaxID=1123057 RepID=U5C190_9BACT|nr:hypothetical protein P872_06695 [Rhodonellum psychrophilum GCM71 = DSM 17998]